VAKAEKSAPKSKAQPKAKDISITLATMGNEPTKKTVKAGFTLANARERWSLPTDVKVTVNGSEQDDSYVFTANDRIVAVPQVKGGC
jgi:hypothetical protein